MENKQVADNVVRCDHSFISLNDSIRNYERALILGIDLHTERLYSIVVKTLEIVPALIFLG